MTYRYPSSPSPHVRRRPKAHAQRHTGMDRGWAPFVSPAASCLKIARARFINLQTGGRGGRWLTLGSGLVEGSEPVHGPGPVLDVGRTNTACVQLSSSLLASGFWPCSRGNFFGDPFITCSLVILAYQSSIERPGLERTAESGGWVRGEGRLTHTQHAHTHMETRVALQQSRILSLEWGTSAEIPWRSCHTSLQWRTRGSSSAA